MLRYCVWHYNWIKCTGYLKHHINLSFHYYSKSVTSYWGSPLWGIAIITCCIHTFLWLDMIFHLTCCVFSFPWSCQRAFSKPWEILISTLNWRFNLLFFKLKFLTDISSRTTRSTFENNTTSLHRVQNELKSKVCFYTYTGLYLSQNLFNLHDLGYIIMKLNVKNHTG